VKKKDSWKRAGREPPSVEDLRAETEESPLLEAVTREQLVVVCKVRGLAVTLHLNVITSLCISGQQIQSPIQNPVYSLFILRDSILHLN
jgi:hypothetical protein